MRPVSAPPWRPRAVPFCPVDGLLPVAHTEAGQGRPRRGLCILIPPKALCHPHLPPLACSRLKISTPSLGLLLWAELSGYRQSTCLGFSTLSRTGNHPWPLSPASVYLAVLFLLWCEGTGVGLSRAPVNEPSVWAFARWVWPRCQQCPRAHELPAPQVTIGALCGCHQGSTMGQREQAKGNEDPILLPGLGLPPPCSRQLLPVCGPSASDSGVGRSPLSALKILRFSPFSSHFTLNPSTIKTSQGPCCRTQGPAVSC